MPVEIIGEAGTAGASREWINAECQLAIKHLMKACGEPPLEMELEVQWQEHELGEYPTIVNAPHRLVVLGHFEENGKLTNSLNTPPAGKGTSL